MKKVLLLCCCGFLFNTLSAQNPDEEFSFFFNVLSPSSLYNVYPPDELGFATGWSVPVTEAVQGALALAPDAGEIPFTYCEESDTDYTGRFVLVDRGNCFFADKVYYAQVSGAVGVVIVNNVGGEIIPMAGGGDFALEVSIPVVMVDAEIGGALAVALANEEEVVVEVSPEPAPFASVVGQVGKDSDGDCISGADEIKLGGWKITAANETTARIGYSDTNGNFNIFTGLGTYTVTAEPPTDIWNVCNAEQEVTFGDFTETEVNFAAPATVDCAQMSVQLAAPFWRRCFANQLVINYCNVGSITAEDAYAELSLSPLQEIEESSHPFTVNDEGHYIFNVGNDAGEVSVGNCGQILLSVYTSCDAALGQVLCAEAEAFPGDPCVNPAAGWSGAEVYAEAVCGDQTILVLSNQGTGDMTAPSTYRIIRNDELIEEGTFQLNAGQETVFNYPADGIYRIEADPEVTQPFVTLPSDTNLECQVTDMPEALLLQYAAADYGVSYDELCLEVIGAYDPNDKNANPRGYGEQHFIDQNTDIEYMIRFQNTGTDTAFNIVVLDTLSESFNVSSLRTGAASHSYELRILDGHILEFTFADIQLVDSFANEPASHGYFVYTISQNADVPLGTIIENSAAIYFDFNEPVITNVFFHEVGRDFLPVTSVSNPALPSVHTLLSPNPLTDVVQVAVEATDFRTGRLELTDAAGKTVLTQSFVQRTFTVNTEDLAAGVYFYRVFLDGEGVSSGKVVK